MKLYDLTLSGNCHKVRLFLSLIGQPVELVPVNLLAGEQKQPAFREINPRGQIPVLEDGDFRLGDSQAILVYLAQRYAPEWFPQDAEAQGRIASWLSFAANEVQHGPATLRLGKLFGRPIDEPLAQARAASTLRTLERHLAQHAWLAQTSEPTIADIAVYPNVALGGDGGLDLQAYPALQAWFARVRALPGYLGMLGL
ncbi:glutathione S-transferase [Stutzerimonas kunmingensis]|uniref:glutathione S-transferase family protein n=1 Tax=Stutzerimonas stutzeri subgroup TaxID=578833 RepID=UPI0008F2EC3E|nr:glutathione S-transferase family protein [Stutzerimonas kunmingensis]MCQ2042266.1 glutathione S-transferase family protein [Stutzerimonas kunmingensis]RRU97424.1 glutathione S-transferase family protein [Stutzerimonas xanthomarina]SFJ55524.1 glutathione S-transferase [Stutzerimonas kunmingensis]